MPKVTAVLACGGRSSRMGANKLLMRLCGKSVIRRSAEALLGVPDVVRLVVAAPVDLWDIYRRELSCLRLEPIFCKAGGTRSESVKNAAEYAVGEIIMIHDGARPLITRSEIEDSISDAQKYGSSVVCTPLKDTVRWQGERSFCPPREELFTVRTPQTFRLDLYQKMLAVKGDFTDDSQLLDALGGSPHITIGKYTNIKLTTPEDIAAAEAILGGDHMRIGQGYDVHRLTEGRKLILGGVEIPYDKGLLGHSDADVLAHAIMDALLGAAALGDIGHLFPDNDPKYAGADSLLLLGEVCRIMRKAHFEPENIDATVIAQAPKLAPHIGKMRENIANAMGIEVDRVSVKATTEEGLGFTGSGEGIAAQAVAMVMKMG